MAKSRFTLQSVLLIRERERDAARRQMGQAIALIEQIEAELRAGEEARSLCNQELGQLMAQRTINIEAVNIRRYHLGRLDIEILGVKSRLQAGREILEKCRQLLVLADQKVKAIEQIREKRELEALHEAIQIESREQEEAWQAGQGSP
jgi:flagellar FliJ protein